MNSEEKRYNETWIIELTTGVKLLQAATPDIMTNHLPRVIAHQDFLCTSELHGLLAIPSVAPRIMRAILFKKLIPITDAAVVNLVQPFLEAVQCHALLWSLGILHGDISDTNLMVDPESKKGVLVDFDLANVIDNGTFDTHPLHGNNRTGTMVFVALDLLGEKGLQGETPLRYRHDLESFCWVFLWICYCYDKGKRTIRYPFKDWIDATPRSCRGAKFAVIGHLQDGGPKPFDSEYSEKFLRRVARYWLDLHNDMDTDFEEPGETETLHFVLGLLPRSQTVEMQWARTYTQVSPTACGSEYMLTGIVYTSEL